MLNQVFNPTNHGNTLYVDPDYGNDTTARSNSAQFPYLTLAAAQTAAVSGDLIHVRPGAYAITAALGKNGVNWWFDEGATVNLTEGETSVTAMWSATVGATYEVRGFGTFNRTATAHVSGPAALLIRVTTGSLIFEAKDLTVTDTAVVGDTPKTIFQTGGSLWLKARNLTVSGSIGTGGSDTTGECVWWVNGTCHVECKKMAATNRAIYSEVVDAPTGDLFVRANDITGANMAVYDASTNADAAMWIECLTARNTNFGVCLFANGTARVYVTAQKVFGAIAAVGSGQFYVSANKVSPVAVAQSLFTGNSTGKSFIRVADWDAESLTTNVFSISSGTHKFEGGYVRSGAAANGLTISGGTGEFDEMTIDTTLNATGNPVAKFSGTLILTGCTLLAESTRDSITAGSAQNVTARGTLAANRPVHANVTLITDAANLYPDLNTLSNAISVVSQAVSVVSTAASNALSVGNAASNAASVVSQALSVANAGLSNLTSAHNVLSNRVSANSSGGPGGSVTSNEVSAVSAQAASAINVVSNAVSVVSVALVSEISNRISADNVLSNAISAASSQISLLTSSYLSLVDRVSANSGAGGGGSVTSTEVSAVSAQAASAISVVSNAVSIVSTAASNALSVANAASQAASVVSTAASNALSVANAASQAGSVNSVAISVVSNAVSIVSTAASNALSVGNAASQAASVVSVALVSEISNRISADNVLSNAISATSSQISLLTSSYLSLVNRVSANSGAGGGGSVTSDELSAVSAQAASALSDAASVGSATAAELSNLISGLSAVVSANAAAVSNLTSAHNALSNLVSGAGNLSDQVSIVSVAVDVVSVAVVALSNAVSAAGGFQQRSFVTTGLTVSGTALVNIPSLSISCAAGAMYALEGKVMFDALTSGGGMGFGLSVPATAARGTGIAMRIICNEAQAAAHTATLIAQGFAAFSAETAGSSVVVSAFMSTINSPRMMDMTGMINTSAAGTIQLGARTSAAGAHILIRSGYVRAYRVG